jgi:tetratricopeptide (TPR) repeat protein
MGMQRGPCTRGILLSACLAFAATAHAACTGQQELTAKLRAQPTTENAIQLGSWFAGHKQFDCAVETFRGALKSDPNSAQLHYLEGLALVGSGQETAAIPAVQEAIRLQPEVIKPHLLLANLYERGGNPAAAEEQWKKALAIDPESAIALDEFSHALLARKDYVGVITLLEGAPRTEVFAIRMAEALTELGHLKDANAVLLEAMKLAPDSIPLANAESVVLIKQRSYLEATKLWKYMVARHPGNRAAELPYLRVLVLTEHNDLARPLGLKLLAQTPHDWEVLYLNGVVDYAVGDYAASKAHLEEAVSLVPDFFYSRYHLGVVLVALREWKEAKEHLEKAIALGDTDKKVHYELAMALHGLGESDRAAQELQQYQDYRQSEEANTEAASLTAQADTEFAAGNIKDAVEHYRQACDVSPKNAGYKFKLSIALNKAGDLEAERAQLEQAVKLDPQLAPAQKQLGYLLAKSGDEAGAVEHFQLAVHAAPRWVEAWINLAGALAVEEHFPEARDAAATALRLDPANEQARRLNDQLAIDPAASQSQP